MISGIVCLPIFLLFSPDSLLVDKFKTAHLFSAHIGRHAERKKFRGQTPLKCFYLMKTPFGTSLANDFRKRLRIVTFAHNEQTFYLPQ